MYISSKKLDQDCGFFVNTFSTISAYEKKSNIFVFFVVIFLIKLFNILYRIFHVSGKQMWYYYGDSFNIKVTLTGDQAFHLNYPEDLVAIVLFYFA